MNEPQKQWHLALDSRLNTLWNKEELSLTEADLRHALGAYRLSDALLQLAEVSRKLHSDTYPSEFARLGKTGVRHPVGVFITDFAVSYLASIFLSSKSSDHTYKKKLLSSKQDNLLSLFYLYSNKLQVPERTLKEKGLHTLLIPMYQEQITAQLDFEYMSARQWFLFSEATKNLKSSYKPIQDVFLQHTGLTIPEYIDLSFIFYAIALHNPHINLGSFPKTGTSWYDNLIQDEKIHAYLSLMSTDRQRFRKTYLKRNARLDARHTKNKFNPLLLKPIVRIQETEYVIPSISSFKRACFDGVYWLLDNYYSNNPDLKSDTFRLFFGSLFEEYVRILLKDIYGTGLLESPIEYVNKGSSTQFFDAVVEFDKQVILFESKAIQLNLLASQTGYDELVRAEIVKKVANKAIVQMYKRYREIDTEPSLKRFRNKEKIVVLVCYNLPFGASNLYKSILDEELIVLESSFPGISSFKYYLLDLHDLETFSRARELLQLDQLLEKVANDPHTSIDREVHEAAQSKGIIDPNIIMKTYTSHINYLVQQSNTRT